MKFMNGGVYDSSDLYFLLEMYTVYIFLYVCHLSGLWDRSVRRSANEK